MNKLLLITGDIAAGKSTFAKILSERYCTAVFEKDTIKEILGDCVGFCNREENKRLSNATVEIMCIIKFILAILKNICHRKLFIWYHRYQNNSFLGDCFLVFSQLYYTTSSDELFAFSNKKRCTYAACGVSQTPNRYRKKKGKCDN